MDRKPKSIGKFVHRIPARRTLISLALLILVFPVVALFGSFRSTDQPGTQGEYITMRVYENFTVTSSRIVIVYANDSSELIELVPFKFNDDFLVKNNQILTRTLNKLRGQGYRIVTSASNGKVTSSRNMLITTFVLEK
ncbi:MAG: hypothetical protein NTU98_08810 [Bacteroidetes bacterium]|nr:hypothetical protein [Bacteroidota bacterium]